MYDALTARYTFACPARGEARVPLSAFRRVERLPGASHPALFRITFACGCGGEHTGLVAHDELDWAPLGLEAGSFVNVMTARVDDAAGELADLAARRIGAGGGPWTFYCYPEERPPPGGPPAFTPLAARGRAARGGVPVGVHVGGAGGGGRGGRGRPLRRMLGALGNPRAGPTSRRAVPPGPPRRRGGALLLGRREADRRRVPRRAVLRSLRRPP